mgnify:CR=1 FL=1
MGWWLVVGRWRLFVVVVCGSLLSVVVVFRRSFGGTGTSGVGDGW